MTFNIRRPFGLDGTNHWDHRRDEVVLAIRGQAPDVLGLQE